jgi:uncharacterized repeat protein (TIGR01451 family)
MVRVVIFAALMLSAQSSALAEVPDLTVQLRRIGQPVFTGTAIKHIVEVRNEGDADAANVFVLITLPPSWSFATPRQSDCSFEASVPVPPFGSSDTAERALCAAGRLLAGTSKILTLAVKVPTLLREWPSLRAVQSRSC